MLLLSLSFVLSANSPAQAQYHTPTRQLSVAEYPAFSDDYDLLNMELAAQRQLDHFNNMDLSGTIELGHRLYPLTKAVLSLQKFLQLTAQFKACKTASASSSCYAQFNVQLQAQFNVFAPELQPGDPRYGQSQDSLFTGYATQPLTGVSHPTSTYKFPIYAMPSASDNIHSRDEIDFHGALSGKSLELLYIDNLWDLYMMQIEGGGYVTLDAGGQQRNFYLNFAGTNHQHWSWISAYMLGKGYISNTTNAAQRKFLRLHPERNEEIFSQCPSYVFVKITNTPPMGSEGVPVTDGRSIATDHTLYAFKGLLAYVVSQRPLEDGNYDMEQEDRSRIPMQPFSRFFIDQDTGGAITGKGRADLYFGLSDYAQYAANYEEETGNLYFLFAK